VRLPISYRPFNSGGKGGQHSNKTLNAIEATVTLPDGRVLRASSTRHKDQHRNKKAATEALVERVRAALKPQRDRPDLSERVRTYHQGRNEVVDHASGARRRYDDVLEGDGFAALVDARREALELRKATEPASPGSVGAGADD